MQAKNPKYNSNGTVDLEVEHPQYGWIPFTASPDDTEVHGKELYAEAIAGDFGPIAPYVPIPPTAQQNKNDAERRLATTDWVNQPDVYDPATTPHLLNRSDFITYRSIARQIAVNPVAGNLDWPTEPTAVWSS